MRLALSSPDAVPGNRLDEFLYNLLLSSHSNLTEIISVNNLNSDMLVDVFKWVGENGDLLSKLGAIEIGFKVLKDFPEVEGFLLPLVEELTGADRNPKSDPFALLAALFVMVDGELARTRLLSDKPLFYRRLAAMAQAGLIQRQIQKLIDDYGEFTKWSLGKRLQYFYLQTLVDMRREPKWSPDRVHADQLQAELAGRIFNVAKKHEDNLGAALRNVTIGESEDGIIAKFGGYRPFLPGPLEGSGDNQNEIPAELEAEVRNRLESDKVAAADFVGLVNSTLLFKPNDNHAKKAGEALEAANYRLANLSSSEDLVDLLVGLAHVAAITRNSFLANQVRILVRKYRAHRDFDVPVDQALMIGLKASAAHASVGEWRNFAGDWITELAFGKLDSQKGEALHSHLLTLLHLAPELWTTCSKAEAALEAYCSK